MYIHLIISSIHLFHCVLHSLVMAWWHLISTLPILVAVTAGVSAVYPFPSTAHVVCAYWFGVFTPPMLFEVMELLSGICPDALYGVLLWLHSYGFNLSAVLGVESDSEQSAEGAESGSELVPSPTDNDDDDNDENLPPPPPNLYDGDSGVEWTTNIDGPYYGQNHLPGLLYWDLSIIISCYIYMHLSTTVN